MEFLRAASLFFHFFFFLEVGFTFHYCIICSLSFCGTMYIYKYDQDNENYFIEFHWNFCIRINLNFMIDASCPHKKIQEKSSAGICIVYNTWLLLLKYDKMKTCSDFDALNRSGKHISTPSPPLQSYTSTDLAYFHWTCFFWA